MRGKFCLAFLVAAIGGTILSVDAQSTVDDSASCESSTFDEAVHLIREDLQNCVPSNEQQNNASSISKRDIEDIKAVCASNQQHASESESCISRKDFEELKSQSCISKEDFEELKIACASNRQPSSTVNACEYRACFINVFPVTANVE